MDTNKEKQRRETDLLNAGLTGAASETVQRYGSATKEHFVAYSGEDRELGQTLAKGLKSISESKVNPDYADQNIKQQAGFAAEVKTQARERAEQIINRKEGRSTRTDDIRTQSDGKSNTIGGRNDQLYDIADISSDGFYIEGTGRQLKYVGSDARECCIKLMGKKMDKYRDADVPIEVPSDFYEEVKKELNDRAEALEKQIENAEQRGNDELAAKHRAQLEKVKKTEKNLREGKLTSREAVEARTNPVLSTAKDVTKVAHRAGVESAKYGAAIGGSVSIVKNLVAVVKDEKDPGKAVLDVAKDTSTSAALSYGTGFTGAAIKGVMQNAKNESVRALSGTNLPAILVTVSISAASIMKQYFNEEITGVECFEQLGEQGTGMVSSAMFAIVGQAAIPIPVIGGLIGGMLGYAVASASYGVLQGSLQDQKLAEEERIRVEYACQEQIKLIQEYRQEMEDTIGRYLVTNTATFHDAFSGIKSALEIGDADGFITSANRITEALGGKAAFSNMDELDALMGQDAPIHL